MSPKTKYFKYISVLIIFIAYLFYLPSYKFFPEIINYSNYFSITENDSFLTTLFRTTLFAIISSLINVFIPILLALLLLPYYRKNPNSKAFLFLLIPFTLGQITISFIFKVFLNNAGLIDILLESSPLFNFISLFFIQFWQYGFLFTYIYLLWINNLSDDYLDYAISHKQNKIEYLFDQIFPNVKFLTIALFSLNFIFSFYELSKSTIIFKSSTGFDTEIINQWLHRVYFEYVGIDNMLATVKVFTYSIGIVIVILLVLFTLIFFFLKLLDYNKIFKSNLDFGLVNKSNFSWHKYLLYTLIFFICIPILPTLITIKIDFSQNIYAFFFTFFSSLSAAFISTAICFILGISLRMGWLYNKNQFSRNLVIIVSIIFLFQIISPLFSVLIGYKWFGILGANMNILYMIVWIFSHTILLLPVLTSFFLVVTFTFSNSEIQYLFSHKIDMYTILKFNIIKRFYLEIILTFLIAFSYIWNEAIINKLFSDFIPSYVSNVEMLITGRGANYSLALSFMLLSIIISLSILFTWVLVLNKKRGEFEKNN